MHIYLTNHHEALVVNDQSECVTVTPATEGVLIVNGLEYQIKAGGDAPDFRQETAAHVNAVFIKDGGVAYAVLSPRLYRGELTTHIDPYAYAIECRLHLDCLEKELEKIKKELRKHRGKEEHRALNGILKKEA